MGRKDYVVEIRVYAPGGPVWVAYDLHGSNRENWNVRNVLEILSRRRGLHEFDYRVRRIEQEERVRAAKVIRSFWAGKSLENTAVKVEK